MNEKEELYLDKLKENYGKLLDFVKRVSTGCDGNVLEFLCDLEDDAEILLHEIGEVDNNKVINYKSLSGDSLMR